MYDILKEANEKTSRRAVMAKIRKAFPTLSQVQTYSDKTKGNRTVKLWGIKLGGKWQSDKDKVEGFAEGIRKFIKENEIPGVTVSVIQIPKDEWTIHRGTISLKFTFDQGIYGK